MHKKLQEVLTKKGLKEEDLSKEEKKTYDQWNKVLTQEKLTIESVKEFCLTQKHIIESKWEDLDNSDKKNERLILLHTVYSKLARVTEADKKERESLENYLNSLIDS